MSAWCPGLPAACTHRDSRKHHNGAVRQLGCKGSRSPNAKPTAAFTVGRGATRNGDDSCRPPGCWHFGRRRLAPPHRAARPSAAVRIRPPSSSSPLPRRSRSQALRGYDCPYAAVSHTAAPRRQAPNASAVVITLANLPSRRARVRSRISAGENFASPSAPAWETSASRQ